MKHILKTSSFYDCPGVYGGKHEHTDPVFVNFSKWMLLTLIIILTGFKVNGQALTLLSPNGGEKWMTGTTQTISWEDDGGFTDLYIEFSPSNGEYWYYLAMIYAEDSVSSISLTNNINETESALVRVSRADDPTISDESDTSFSVVSNPVYFYTPAAGDRLYAGMDIMLSWFSYEIDTFDIEYSTDAGASWILAAASQTGTTFLWSTPSVFSDQCIIRITESGNEANYGLSATFSLVEGPTATILSPNGGETWTYGSTATVSWSGSNLPYYVYLDYSADGGETWDYLGYGYGEETGGSVEVYVPYRSSTDAMVRIKDPYYGVVLDESDQAFTIFVPPVIMYNPNEGDEFYIKDNTWISWLATGISEVNIELSTDGGTSWSMVEANVDAGQGWYDWMIGGTPSSACYIRVSDASDATKFGVSGPFTLLQTPVITLTSPAGGEIWKTDSTYVISWLYDRPEAYYIYVDYSIDNGATWNYLGYGFNSEGQGSLEWKTPGIESEQYQVRVRDSYLYFVSDTSNTFTIRPFPNTPICIVSVDSASNQNVIVWEKPQSDLIDAFIIYKESDEMDVYEAIGTVPFDSTAVFTDVNSNPAVKSYRYRLGFSDAAGNIYPMGSMHQTIHLSINKGVGASWNLIWSDYIGINVGSYNIHRSANGADYEMIATISSSFNSFTDVNAPAGTVYYFIEVINENGCNLPNRGYSSSISNIATNNILGIDDPDEVISAKLYPNPAQNFVNLSLDNPGEKVSIQLVDLTGQVVMESKNAQADFRSAQQYDVSYLDNGIYFLKIDSGKKNITLKMIVNH